MGCSLRLQRFCCCCSLKTGTLVIGTIGWVLTVLEIMFAPMENAIIEESDHHINERPVNISQSILIARIGTGLLSLLISVLLVIGVYKKNNKFILPWLVLGCFGCIISAIMCLMFFGFLFVVPSVHLPVFVTCFIIMSLVGVLNFYCWLCVWSHYMDLNDLDRNISPNVQYHPPGFVYAPPEYTKHGAPLA